MALEDGLDGPHRLAGALARQRVLHLREAHEPRAREDAEGAVDALATRGAPRRRAVEHRDGGREAPAGAAEGVEAQPLSTTTSPAHSRSRDGGAGGSSVRVFVRVSATPVCGKVQNSK